VNLRLDRNESANQLIDESNNYYTPRGVVNNANLERFCDDDESTEYNLIVSEAVQFATQLNPTNVQQFFDYQTSQTQNIPTNNQRGETSNNANNTNQERRRQNRLSQSEKKFVCEHCNKEFKLKHHLTRLKDLF